MTKVQLLYKSRFRSCQEQAPGGEGFDDQFQVCKLAWKSQWGTRTNKGISGRPRYVLYR